MKNPIGIMAFLLLLLGTPSQSLVAGNQDGTEPYLVNGKFKLPLNTDEIKEQPMSRPQRCSGAARGKSKMGVYTPIEGGGAACHVHLANLETVETVVDLGSGSSPAIRWPRRSHHVGCKADYPPPLRRLQWEGDAKGYYDEANWPSGGDDFADNPVPSKA